MYTIRYSYRCLLVGCVYIRGPHKGARLPACGRVCTQREPIHPEQQLLWGRAPVPLPHANRPGTAGRGSRGASSPRGVVWAGRCGPDAMQTGRVYAPPRHGAGSQPVPGEPGQSLCWLQVMLRQPPGGFWGPPRCCPPCRGVCLPGQGLPRAPLQPGAASCPCNKPRRRSHLLLALRPGLPGEMTTPAGSRGH